MFSAMKDTYQSIKDHFEKFFEHFQSERNRLERKIDDEVARVESDFEAKMTDEIAKVRSEYENVIREMQDEIIKVRNVISSYIAAKPPAPAPTVNPINPSGAMRG